MRERSLVPRAVRLLSLTRSRLGTSSLSATSFTCRLLAALPSLEGIRAGRRPRSATARRHGHKRVTTPRALSYLVVIVVGLKAL